MWLAGALDMQNKSWVIFTVLVSLALPAMAQSVATLTSGGLLEPHGIVTDSENNLFITDQGNNRVVKFLPDTGVLQNLAGAIGFSGTNNGKGFLARFSAPQGIVLAREGVVVADSGNHAIRHISLNGVVTTLSGQLGVAGFADSGPGGNGARFRFPSGLAADPDGTIYVADTKNSAIRRIAMDGSVTTLAGTTNGFYEPAGVTVWTNGLLLVADTRNHSVKSLNLSSGIATLLAGANSRFGDGQENSLYATNATLSNPLSVLWLGPEAGIIISDSGNHTLRRLFFEPEIETFSIETFAGSLGSPGFINGLLKDSKFNSPAGLSSDFLNTGFAIADLANNAIRRVQRSPVQPPVKTPQIGWVEFVFNENLGRTESKLRPVTSEVFNNDVPIAIIGEVQTVTRFTSSATSPNLLSKDVPPDPGKKGLDAPNYRDGLSTDQAAKLNYYINGQVDPPGPDVTIKAIGTHTERRSSSIVQARFQFRVSNPGIVGANPAQFSVSTATQKAAVYYTVDGSEPVANGDGRAGVSHLLEGDGTIRLRITTNDIVFQAKGFRANYASSQIVSNVFYATNYLPNLMAFGFARSRTNKVEGASEFIGSPGQRFFAPVTLNLQADQSIFAMQFGLSVTNGAGAPRVIGQLVGFESMLKRVRPGSPPIFVNIPPSFATDAATGGTNITSLLVTNATQNFLGVGWLERYGGSTLYDTSSQDLISYSKIVETVFRKADKRVVLGGFSFVIPSNSSLSDSYEIQLSRPSATKYDIDAVSRDVFIDLPLNGSQTVGSINAIKRITLAAPGERSYVVGDLSPFYWLNAGDFGDGNIINQDVSQIFHTAANQVNLPPQGSDLFDAMDACCAVTSTTFREVKVGKRPTGLALSDFNQDGLLDLLTTNFDDDSLTFRLGNGDGSFGPVTRTALGIGTIQPVDLSVMDVNGDGKLDVLVPTSFSDLIHIHFGNGHGSFSAADRYANGSGVGAETRAVALADIDRDGFGDLLIANRQTGRLNLLTNNTFGTYVIKTGYLSGSGNRSGPKSVVVSDLNSDGWLDAVSANEFDGTISILTNTAAGDLVLSSNIVVGGSIASAPSQVLLGDMTNTGLPVDIITVNPGASNFTVILRSGGGFLAPVSYPGGVGNNSLTVVDLNNDGFGDVAVTSPQTNSVLVFLNTGTGVLGLPRSYSVGRNPSRVVAGDLDGRGGPDLAVSNADESTVTILMNDGSGQFSSPIVASSDIFEGSRTNEINQISFGDGTIDVNDLFVTFRRSLDTSLSWYRRFWSNGVLVAKLEANGPSQAKRLLGSEVRQGSIKTASSTKQIEGNVPLHARVTVDATQGVAGQTVLIPVRGRTQGNLPLKIMLLNVEVLPLDAAPPLDEQVKLFPDAAFGSVSFSSSDSLGNAAVACLNNDSVGIFGDATIAKLRLTIPANARPRDAYVVRVSRFSASPDGLSGVPTSIEHGLLTLSNRDESSLGDGIPDSWRLTYFGSLDNALSLANADADGDGVSNWQEYRMGTNPNDTRSALRLSGRGQIAAGGNFSGVIVLRWPSVQNKEYFLESSTRIFGGVWLPTSSTMLGTGGELSVEASTGSDAQRFFRVRLAER